MKRMTAKEVLAESFKELATSKTIDKITVKEIADNCGYSTATFYRQFKDKYDLIAWDYAQRVSKIMRQIGADGYEWRQTLTEGAMLFDNNREYLKNLFLHTNGYDSFLYYKTEINYQILKDCIMRKNGLNTLDKMTDMYVRTYCLGTVNLTCEWILGKYEATAQELAQIFENSLPEPLKKYLY